MKTLNNKYLIESCIESDENFLVYKVRNKFNHQKYNFYILQNDFEYENCREYLLSKFRTIKNLNFDNVVNLIDVEVIKNIDGINLDKVQYGYTTEYIDYNIDFQSYISKCTFNEKLDIFMAICAAVNTLNINGYIFDEINIKDLNITINKEVNVKIKNLLQYEISKFSTNNLLNIKKLSYPYNLERQGQEGLVKDNIKEILDLFKVLFTEKELEDEFKCINYTEKRVSFNKMPKITNFIKNINKDLNKNFNIFVFEALNNVKTNLDIIGMEDEIKKVEIAFKQILENKLRYKIVSFIGEEGTGKTTTIKEIKYKIINKYFTNKLEKPYLLIDNLENSSSYISMLETIYDNLDKSLKDKYGVYLKKFIDMLFGEDVINDKNTLQVINRVCKFLNEYTLNTTLIILLDDLDQSKYLFKLFFKYFCLLGNKLENIMIIFSINQDNNDSEMIEFIKELVSLENYEEHKINYFNNYNTSKMVKSMLNSHKSIDKLCMKIYEETLGKPQFISQTIKELYKDGTIYVSREDGLWKSKVDIHDIVIPKSIEKTLENKILDLSMEEVKVLECLCIYKSALSETLIFSYVFLDKKRRLIYNDLKQKGFLIDKISDSGIRVDFYNDLVKKIIYSKLDHDRKLRMHNESCEFLEKVLNNTDEYLDEFLNQLEKSMKYDKLIEYSLRCGKALDVIGDTFKSISYYKKALKYAQGKSKSKISISIAKLNEKVGEEKEAYKYFNKANIYVLDNGEMELQIYALLRMIIIKAKECKTINLYNSLNVVRDLLNKIIYPKGEAYYYYALALLAKIERDKQLCLNYIEKVFEICNKNNINVGVYAWSKVLFSQIYISQGICDKKIKDSLKEALSIFNIENNYVGILSAKLNYQLVNKECGKDIKDILKDILEVNKLSNKYKVYKKEVSSLIQIAIIYIENKEYKNSVKELLYALEIAKEHNFDRYIFRICNFLCWSYSKLGDLKLASNYYNLIMEIKNSVKLSEFDIVNLKSTSALYNYLIYNFEFAFKELKDINEIILDYQSFEYSKIRCQYYQVLIFKSKNECEIKKIVNLLIDEVQKIKKRFIRAEILITSIRIILDLGYKDFAKELFFNLEEYPNDYDTQMEYMYLELNFRCPNCYNTLINKALRIISFGNNKNIKANIYSIIAEKYDELGCYELAINYYYESIDMFINIIKSLPEKDQLLYVNNSRFLIVYNKFRTTLKKLIFTEIGLKIIDKLDNILEMQELLEKLKTDNILKNKKIFNLMQEFYSKCYYNYVIDIDEILKNFSSDIIKNLETILKYFARITLANKAMIVMENNIGENEVICEYRISDKNEIQKYFSLKVDSTQDVLIISNNDNRINDKISYNQMKSCMYIKFSNKGKLINSNERIKGKLILISDNAINYINSESKNKVEKAIPFIIFLLDQYKLRINSTLDKLTGAYNRKYLETSFHDLLDYSYEKNKEFSLIIFDIDDFKGVNDRYGHQTGDDVLVKITKEVKKCLAKKDVFVRYGGEEFILLLPNKGENAAYNLAEKIRKQVEKAKILGDKRKVTISLGISVYLKHSFNSEELINLADQALYKSKAEGKNKSTIWSKNLISINKSNDSESRINTIFQSNYTKDDNFKLVTKDIMEMIKIKSSIKEKIYYFLSRIIQITESEYASIFIIQNNKILKVYNKKRYEQGVCDIKDFNWDLIKESINNNNDLCLIDWNNTYINESFGIPDWKSLCITPLIFNGYIVALIYISISVNEKEFTKDDLNLIKYFGQLSISLFC
ncbi:GGDEF domain-containing protein [Clostridium weizhouense]|uniref:Diguanylate cyclase n=1 Tax=Clostridium weizhouense TaxID=2859781 RepID=A0ABS7AJ21_9CLOT|nr:diguanylate cyclase [Clostridium weizhouense]MBW6408637.1 diguanylate cyclase [Clostridium weizhouense]